MDYITRKCTAPMMQTNFLNYHERSHENPGLQAVDLFCWGIFRKYEAGDTEWHEMYRNAIASETEYLR